ncbi:4'-phosphopantetheinyl transferase superfamily protein [Streptosporangium canum]|uniref:4'-phosphopantetheinyl transferase family protein n=1 Tax=Streptosporangium canum TaxID=324952 RepID=UPI0033A1FECF
MIEELLPAAVVTAEAFDDPLELGLHLEEEPAVARAVAVRRREFTTGRHLARSCLEELGLPPGPILKDQRGAPRWPEGVVGSITHCAGYRAAVVARRSTLATVGVDAEPNEPLPTNVLELVASAAEQARLAGLTAAIPGVAWDRLLFSAKESVYKAWFPLTGLFLDFDGADITFGHDLDGGIGRFTTRLLVLGPIVKGKRLDVFAGRFAVRDGLVLTAVAEPA